VNMRSKITSSTVLGLVGLLAVASLGGFGLLGCGPRDELEEVRRLQLAGKHQAAIEPLRSLLESRPGDPEVLYRYGSALAATGDAAVAVWPLRQAMEDPEWRAAAGLNLVAALTANSGFGDAIEVCEGILESDPENVQMLLLCADARVRSRRDYPGALADADRVLELEPDNVAALVPRAVALLALGRIDEAAEVLAKLDDVHRDQSIGLQGSPRFCAVRAKFAQERGEIELAERRFNECLEGFPDDGLVIQEAIGFFDAIQKGERSMEILEGLIEEMPAAHLYRKSLVLRLHAQGRDEEAIEVLLEGTRLDAPSDVATGWASLAGFYAEIGRGDDAIESYEKCLAVQADPSPDLLFEYADTLAMFERYDRALEVADQMSVPAHRGLVRGRVYLDQGDPKRALASFDEGLRFWPDNAIARYYAAIASERVGDFDRAIGEYRYAIRADPSGTDARLRLARIYLAEGNDALALSVLQQHGGPGVPGALEAGVLRVRLLARERRMDPPPQDISQIFGPREHWALGASTRALGHDDEFGPTLALKTLRGADMLDLASPQDAVALETMIDLLARAGLSEKGTPLVRKALAAHPDEAVFHALLGRALAYEGAGPDAIRAAHERALELDPRTSIALRSLAGIEAEAGRSEQVLALYERAAEVTPTDPDVLLPLAESLLSAGRSDAAIERLEELLDEHPYDARAAMMLAQQLLDRGDVTRARELAERALRFKGGPEAEALVESIGSGSGATPADSEPASPGATPPPA